MGARARRRHRRRARHRPAFAGSDTLATAKALAAALDARRTVRPRPRRPQLGRRRHRPGRARARRAARPAVPHRRALPRARGRRTLAPALRARRRLGAGRGRAPGRALVRRAADRPEQGRPRRRAAVPAERIRRVAAADLGAGPWGADGEPDLGRPGARCMAIVASGGIAADGAARRAGARRRSRCSSNAARSTQRCDDPRPIGRVPRPAGRRTRRSASSLEPDRAHSTRELLGAAAALAAEVDGRVTASTRRRPRSRRCSASWGADEVVHARRRRRRGRRRPRRSPIGRDRRAVGGARAEHRVGPRGRGAVPRRALGAGLTGDAVDLEVDDGRLIAWKPAFGGQLVAAITRVVDRPDGDRARRACCPTLDARVRTDADDRDASRSRRAGRVRVLARTRDDDLDVLAEARVVIGVGTGRRARRLRAARAAARVLGAELGADPQGHRQGLAAARPPDRHHRPQRSRPRLYVALGASGKFNHMVGVRARRHGARRSTPTPTRSSSTPPTSASSATGARSLPLLVEELASAHATGSPGCRFLGGRQNAARRSGAADADEPVSSSRCEPSGRRDVERVVERPLARTERADRDAERGEHPRCTPSPRPGVEHEEAVVAVVGDHATSTTPTTRAAGERREQARRSARRQRRVSVIVTIHA